MASRIIYTTVLMNLIETFNRTVEDVKILIHHAKLTEEELMPVTQTLEFSDDYGELNDVCLMQLNPDLSNILKKGDK